MDLVAVAPPPASALTEPVERAVEMLLRRAVVEHGRTERRRVYPPVVHVGVPARPGGVVRLELGDQRLDHALRTDALEAMVRRARRVSPTPLVWLTRSGGPETREVDLRWLAAARAAAAELATALPMVVVTRRAWRDPGTGVGRTWARPRPPVAGPDEMPDG